MRFLSLAELEASSRSLSTIFFSFFHSWVASQETLAAKRSSHVRRNSQQRFANAVAHSTSLAGFSTTVAFSHNVILPSGSNSIKRLHDEQLKGFPTNVDAHRHTIDRYIALAWGYPHSGRRVFPMTRPIISCGLFQYPSSVESLRVCGFTGRRVNLGTRRRADSQTS